jgi:hypothetical protein
LRDRSVPLDNFTHRGKTRGSRSRFPQNGGDSQHISNNQMQASNENSVGSQRLRRGSAYRGINRGQNRASHRQTDRTYSEQPQDSNIDSSSPSDTTQRLTDVPYSNRRGRGSSAGGGNGTRHQPQEQWDVGNWNGETLIYSRTTKEEEQQPSNSDGTSNVLSEGTLFY